MENFRYFGIYPASTTVVPEGQRPVVLVDDTLYSLSELASGKATGSFALVGSCNEKNIATICDSLEVDAVQFSEMRVENLDVLRRLGELQHLGITWNTKLEDLSFLHNHPNLKSLILSDTPKVSDLTPISSLTHLLSLEISGGIWNKNRAVSLAPITSLASLESLTLLNIKVDDGSLAPIAQLNTLQRLSLSNQFKTEEYAYLKTRLTETECKMFAPYVELQSPIENKDVMVVGSRKPFLNSQADAERLARYVEKFEAMVRQFALERNAT